MQAADIYGYVDEKGVAHFASERLDARYQLFFRAARASIQPMAWGPAWQGRLAAPHVPLLATFNASPGYKSAKRALRDASRMHDIDIELLQAVIATESGFDPEAISPKGAIGLMQVMPDTAQRYGVRPDARASVENKLMDPKLNIATGSKYLRDLIAMFPGRTDLALAAYNAGEGAVQRAGNRDPQLPETQNYVSTVMQLYAYLKPAAIVAGGQVTGAGAHGTGRAQGRCARARQPAAVPAATPSFLN